MLRPPRIEFLPPVHIRVFIKCNVQSRRLLSPHVYVCAASTATTDIAVIGGGAAGLTAAYFAAASQPQLQSQSRPLRITVLEKNDEPGKKILISGGTRCNILPAPSQLTDIDLQRDYFFTDPRSVSPLRSIFSRWSLQECRQWIEQDIGILLTTEPDTQKLFPASHSAREVRDKLVAACRKQGVEFMPRASLLDLYHTNTSTVPGQEEREENQTWTCVLEDGRTVRANVVVLATGGKSFPSLGTNGIGYSLLKDDRIGHGVVHPYPALTPLRGTHPGGGSWGGGRGGERDNERSLPGISVYNAALSVTYDVALDDKNTDNQFVPSVHENENGKGASTKKKKKKRKKKVVEAERSALLLTHRGFSGPAAMDLSHYISMHETKARAVPPPVLTVCWVRDMKKSDWEHFFALSTSMTVFNTIKSKGIPSRLVEALLQDCTIPPNRRVAELRKEERVRLLEALCAYALDVTGTEGYPKAEVTGGGCPYVSWTVQPWSRGRVLGQRGGGCLCVVSW